VALFFNYPTTKLSNYLTHGAEEQNRTADTTVFSRVLYQLSYLGAQTLLYAFSPFCQTRKKSAPLLIRADAKAAPHQIRLSSSRRRRREETTNRKGGEEVRLNRKQKTTGVRLWFDARNHCATDVPFNAYEVS
jgi:hypothetical protein